MAKKRIVSELMGGDILLHGGLAQQWKFLLYLFILMILYISLNFGMERALLTERRNQRELKHLKADYTSKSARLMYKSKRIEIEKKLQEFNSGLIAPQEPPVIIKADI